jgi:hypothetical protein
MQILSEKVGDQRFLRLICGMLRAGYMEDWEYKDTLSGCPQGSLCSAEHKPPYEQCRVMRSAGPLALVRATRGLEHCA